VVNFTTAPSNATKNSVRFLAWGDMGIGVENHPWYQPDIPEAQVAEAMWNSWNQSDFLLALGDIAYFSGKGHEYDQRLFPYFYRQWATKPLFLTPGNHDYEQDNAETFLSFFPQKRNAYNESHKGRYYSFDWGNVHFTALDTEWLRYDTPDSSDGMLRWLEDDLLNTTQPWRVVFMHKMPYDSGYVADDTIIAYLVPLFEKYRVAFVLGGHWHNYQRYPAVIGDQVVDPSKGGVTYIISGGGGYEIDGYLHLDQNGKRVIDPIRPDERNRKLSPAPNPVVSQDLYHYMSWEIEDDCSAHLQAIDKDLNTIDDFTVNICQL